MRRATAALAALFLVGACALEESSGGDDSPAATDNTAVNAAASTLSLDPSTVSDAPTPEEAARFLTAASFGPTSADIDYLVREGYSEWFREQMRIPMTKIGERLPIESTYFDTQPHWWRNAVYGRDQLRQRMAFALSQIFVVSAVDGNVRQYGHMMARYMDILQEGAFGAYGDLLHDVTYSPAMGIFLTYIGNEKANPETGAAPDENYAREVMQLFTIGLSELNLDGTARLDPAGQPIETYTNMDITELAKVFTGLWWADLRFRRDTRDITPAIERSAMVMDEDAHSDDAKTFLGLSIPANTPGDESIRLALDHLAAHPNTAPFISRQLIQRFTTSNPSPAYVERVATAFQLGQASLPDGATVGDGTPGDFRAVLAAILFDAEALNTTSATNAGFGKIREPVVRFAHWARAFNINSADVAQWSAMRDLNRPDRLNQQPFRSPSVFNFYRSGYVAPGSATANAGLVAPELQITDSTSVIGYANFMQSAIFRDADDDVFVPNYGPELALADDPDALADRLNRILMTGRMRSQTRARIVSAINAVQSNDAEDRRRARVEAAVLMAVMAPEFLVQF